MLDVLEIGPGPKPQAQLLWPDARIITTDLNPAAKADYRYDAVKLPGKWAGKFDIVFASHVLEHIPYWNAVQTLRHWGSVLKPNGQVHVVVPSLEWVAREVLSEHPSRAILPHLHAGLCDPWDVHMASFTMRYLRACFEEAGFAVTRARSGPYTILVQDKPYQAEQHYVAGEKR